MAHWTAGAGADYNPARRSALETVKVVDSIADVVDDIRRVEKKDPKTVATCARDYPSSIGYREFRSILERGEPHLLIFGTAWGLAETFIAGADYILAPIKGAGDYNHLSVRTAAGIILDRLLGKE